MSAKPFKLDAPKGGKVTVGDNGRPKFNIAETNDHAVDEQETLVEAGQENRQPDFEVDSLTPDEAGQAHGEDHAQRPAYRVANPWPAAKPVAHKPYKL